MMEPLNALEIQELLEAMGYGVLPCPIGSLWSSGDASQMYCVLHHANMPTESGPVPSVVLQSLPDGSAWVQPTEVFLNGGWQMVGFVWDRGVHV